MKKNNDVNDDVFKDLIIDYTFINGINLRDFLNYRYMYFSLFLVELVCGTIGLILGFVCGNTRIGGLVGLLIGLPIGIYIGFQVTKKIKSLEKSKK